MKNRFALFTLLLFSFSVVAFSQPDMMPKRGMQFMNKLNLTDQQKEQFQKIHFDTQKKNIDLGAKLASAKLDLKQMLTGDKQDKAAIEKKMKEIADVQVSLKMNRYNAWSECNKVLNADQQKIWKQALQMHLSGNMGRYAMMNDRRPMMQNHRPMMKQRQQMMQNAPEN